MTQSSQEVPVATAPVAPAKPTYLSKAFKNVDKNKAFRTVIYANEGVGKTTLACSAPNCLLIQTEDGSVGITSDSVTILPIIKQYEQVKEVLHEVGGLIGKDGTLPFDYIIIDSVTALERLIHDYTLRQDPKYLTDSSLGMEKALGSFGAAYTFATDEFTRFLAILNWFISKGINIILTCHSMTVTEKNTLVGDEYSTTDLALHSPKNGKTVGKRELLRQWADLVGYLHTPLYVTGKEGSIRTAINATNDKLLGLSGNPRYFAKNRFTTVEPVSIPLVNGWDTVLMAIGKKANNQVTPTPAAAPTPPAPVAVADNSIESMLI